MTEDLMELGSIGATTQSFRPVNYAFSLSTSTTPQASVPVIQVHMPSTTSGLLALDVQTASWVLQVLKKLESFGRLKRNWDSHDGLPLSTEAKRTTFDALGWLKNQELPVPTVVLGSGGTVHLEWRANGKELEVGFDDRGIAEYLKVESDGCWEEGEDVDEEIREKLITLAEWLKNG